MVMNSDARHPKEFSTENTLGGNFVLRLGAAVGQLCTTTPLVALFGPKRYLVRFSKPVRQFMRIETDCPSRLPPSFRPSKLVTFIAFSPKIMPV
jgi:hypothetical protein